MWHLMFLYTSECCFIYWCFVLCFWYDDGGCKRDRIERWRGIVRCIFETLQLKDIEPPAVNSPIVTNCTRRRLNKNLRIYHIATPHIYNCNPLYNIHHFLQHKIVKKLTLLSASITRNDRRAYIVLFVVLFDVIFVYL